jgi:hypothetical protein
MAFALWSVVMLAIVYFVPWKKVNYDGHVTPDGESKSIEYIYRLFLFFFISGVVFVARCDNRKACIVDPGRLSLVKLRL